MLIGSLNDSDIGALSDFMVCAYRAYPMATWFCSEPSLGEMERLFLNKVRGIGMRSVVDTVCEDRSRIVGECEIVKIAYDVGVIGIIVRPEYADRHIGSAMLETAIKEAAEIGVTKLTAEVMEDNKDAFKFFIDNGFAPLGIEKGERGGRSVRLAVLQRDIT